MKKLTLDFGLKAEVQAVSDFISQKWTPINNLEGLIAEIAEKAFRIGSTWLEQYDTGHRAYELLDARVAQLGAELTSDEADIIQYYDAYCCFLSKVSFKTSALRDAGINFLSTWDYGREVNRIAAALYDCYPGLTDAKPHGWAELEKGYIDFDGQAEYDPRPDRELFQGTDVKAVCFGGLTSSLALPYVMYSEVCQGRKASRELVGVVFSHFLTIQETLNGMKFVRDLDALIEQAPKKPVFHLMSLPSSNPFLQVVFDDWEPDLNSETMFHKAIESRQAAKARPAEETAQMEAERDARIAELLSKLGQQSPDELQAAAEREHAFRGCFVRQFSTLRG